MERLICEVCFGMDQARPKTRFNLRRFAMLVIGLLVAWVVAGIAVRAVLLAQYADYHAKVRAHVPTMDEVNSSAEVRLNLLAKAYEDLQASNVFTAACLGWKLTIYT